MRIGIVILNWNGEDLLKKFLPSVYNNSEGHQIYVVDNIYLMFLRVIIYTW